ncbi:hypothetical protein [Roseibium aggregatum]|uniref:Uncharacterized protein n=1 Tax=Roseibium aggregatum TaxID=187304 RepID=A0A0M6Y7R0_9HYPH|nr:hypothetical protein [Roseibium aggregatum]CTQ45708.1 hypothetical protein LAL4801_04163 [Roseibium aggregatum]
MFTEKQIAELRAGYAKINRVGVESPAYDRLVKMVDNFDDETMLQIKDAGIKWMSSLALTRCIRRGLVKCD